MIHFASCLTVIMVCLIGASHSADLQDLNHQDHLLMKQMNDYESLQQDPTFFGGKIWPKSSSAETTTNKSDSPQAVHGLPQKLRTARLLPDPASDKNETDLDVTDTIRSLALVKRPKNGATKVKRFNEEFFNFPNFPAHSPSRPDLRRRDQEGEDDDEEQQDRQGPANNPNLPRFSPSPRFAGESVVSNSIPDRSDEYAQGKFAEDKKGYGHHGHHGHHHGGYHHHGRVHIKAYRGKSKDHHGHDHYGKHYFVPWGYHFYQPHDSHKGHYH